MRGIALRTEQLALEQWIDRLAAELVAEAGKTESDRRRARTDAGRLMARARADPDAVRRAEEGIRAIEAGGIPPAASERLRATRRAAVAFSPLISVHRGVPARPPVGLPAADPGDGSCFYTVGWQATPIGGGWGYYGGSGTVELDVQSEAWNEARRLALDRLAQEAQARRRRRGARRADSAAATTTGHKA